MKRNIDQLYFFAGILTWLVVFAISVLQLQSSDFLIEAVVLQLLILLTMFFAVRPQSIEPKKGWNIASLIMMLVLIFALSWTVSVDYFFIYSIVWVSISVNYFSYRSAWAWLGLIVLLWYLTKAFLWNDQNPFFETLLEGTFHVFAMLSSMVALQSKLANEKTQELNRELVATQHLLTQASKESERTRIARDLHDLLGHHLTALTINLQVASRLSEGEVKETIDRCHGLSKLLLSDVRDAVSTLRDTPSVNLPELLALAVKDVPRLSISLEIDDNVRIKDVRLAETVLRCVQEAITNSLRHSSALRVLIRLNVIDENLMLSIHDDGTAGQEITLGNGLTGMRERIFAFDGEFTLNTENGFCIDIRIPLEHSE